MAGAGIYVTSGEMLKNLVGPAIPISFLVSGLAAMLCALCYAEFGAKFPKSGSSYSYVYVVMGELWAFLVGWNLLLEVILCFAVVTKAASGVTDSILGFAPSRFIMEYIGTFNRPGLGEYPDFISLVFIIVITVIVCIGAKVTGVFNNILTILNIIIMLLIVGLGLYLADISNWTNTSHGGYLPYGVSGIFSAASLCFVSYLGFECIAVAGEEVLNPSKNIPLATIISISIITLLYIAASLSLSLIVPYYKVSLKAPFQEAFASYNIMWATILVSFGTLTTLTASLIGSLFSCSRLLYALSTDGLIFELFSRINCTTYTPIYSIVFSGIVTAVLSFFIDMSYLLELLSIGILFAFTMIAVSLILLRYQTADECPFPLKEANDKPFPGAKNLIKNPQKLENIGKLKAPFKNLLLFKIIPERHVSTTSVSLMVISLMVIVPFFKHAPLSSWWTILVCVIFICVFIAAFLLVCTLEKNTSFATFQVFYLFSQLTHF